MTKVSHTLNGIEICKENLHPWQKDGDLADENDVVVVDDTTEVTTEIQGSNNDHLFLS